MHSHIANPLQTRIVETLVTLGWRADRVCGDRVTRDFDTAAGGRTGVIYCFLASNGLPILSGDYESEGYNALSTTIVFVPGNLGETALTHLVTDFETDVRAQIDATYARRLMTPSKDQIDATVPRG